MPERGSKRRVIYLSSSSEEDDEEESDEEYDDEDDDEGESEEEFDNGCSDNDCDEVLSQRVIRFLKGTFLLFPLIIRHCVEIRVQSRSVD